MSSQNLRELLKQSQISILFYPFSLFSLFCPSFSLLPLFFSFFPIIAYVSWHFGQDPFPPMMTLGSRPSGASADMWMFPYPARSTKRVSSPKPRLGKYPLFKQTTTASELRVTTKRCLVQVWPDQESKVKSLTLTILVIRWGYIYLFNFKGNKQLVDWNSTANKKLMLIRNLEWKVFDTKTKKTKLLNEKSNNVGKLTLLRGPTVFLFIR